jgi:hypothetical protein
VVFWSLCFALFVFALFIFVIFELMDVLARIVQFELDKGSRTA